MESGDHLKNGVSPKNQRSRGNILNYLIIAFLCVSSVFISCGKDGNDGKQGDKGEQGDKGDKGDKGVDAVITISADGYWVINGEKTNVKAEGTQGDKGDQGEKGEQGEPGATPIIMISDDGFWVIDGIKTDVKAEGYKGDKGEQGEPGVAPVITISSDGYWVIDGEKTNVKAEGSKGDKGDQGDKGEPGLAPVITISSDGYWVIDGEKTNVKAEGEQGNQGNDGKNSYLVIFDANGGLPLFRIFGVLHGETVNAPSDPTKKGYKFSGWYTEESFENAWNFSTSVTDNVTLYAKWIGIITMTTAKSGEATIRMAGSGTFTVDWDDGSAIETHTLQTYASGWNFSPEYLYVHNYSGADSKTITIIGEEITLFECNFNQFTSLDVSKNTALTYLDCSNNLLDNLDVRKNTALTSLNFHSNLLSNIDLSKNISLTHLGCSNNKLIGIDVSKNTALFHLYCRKNQLTTSALNALFETLPLKGIGYINIEENPGSESCDPSIATNKGWTFFED